MSKAETPKRWYSPWRSSNRPTQDDLADMGTAFGLDCSLNPLYQDAPPAPEAPRKPGWVGRWALRRRAAD